MRQFQQLLLIDSPLVINAASLRGGRDTLRLHMTFKESVILAIKLARKQKEELVVGLEEGRWNILPITDPRSDQLAPSLIVTGNGIKYPEDEDLFARLVSEGA